ncbi:MAG: PQQ-binding-like beta-propeller repeat protein, partial [Verrucomicrobiota bacterium]
MNHRDPRSAGCRLRIVRAWLFLFGISSIGNLGASEAWPQFRGPGGNGHAAATKLPLTWSEEENIVWKESVPGKGWSSPVVAGGKVFLTTAVADGEDQDANGVDRSLRVLAVDLGTGKLLWNREVFTQSGADAPRIHRKNSHASVTALVEGERLYVHFGHMGSACLTAEGEIVWKSRKLPYAPVHGNGGCPILVGEHLIFSCDGKEDPFVAALKKDTGEVAWKTPRDTVAKKTFSFSTPSYFEIDGVPQVISPGSNGVMAYDPRSGKELWRCSYDGYSVIPKPLYAHGLLFVGTGYDDATLMAIKPGKTGDVAGDHVAWTIRKRAPHTASFLVIGDELYFVADNGTATCVDARTGDIHWQQRSGGRAFSASPLYADNRIYLQDENGKGIVLAPGKEFKVLAENQLEGRTLSSYAAIDSALIIRSETHLYRIGQAEPSSPP